jgi:hypothetical protein
MDLSKVMKPVCVGFTDGFFLFTYTVNRTEEMMRVKEMNDKLELSIGLFSDRLILDIDKGSNLGLDLYSQMLNFK